MPVLRRSHFLYVTDTFFHNYLEKFSENFNLCHIVYYGDDWKMFAFYIFFKIHICNLRIIFCILFVFTIKRDKDVLFHMASNPRILSVMYSQ